MAENNRIDDLIIVVAGLNDALKYLIRHGPNDTSQAETKRQYAERKLMTIAIGKSDGKK